jgi:hypothetical protein
MYSTAIVPVTVLSSRRAPTDVPFHPKYHGTVLFKNAFNGMLPATDYPKVNVRAFRSGDRLHRTNPLI